MSASSFEGVECKVLNFGGRGRITTLEKVQTEGEREVPNFGEFLIT